MTVGVRVDRPGADGSHGLGRVEFICLMSVVTATIAISIDTILPAFDEMEESFGLGPGGTSISLSITVFLAALGIGMLVWGPLSDRFGRRRTMFVSLALFVFGALVSTMANSFAVFLVGRVVWGVAAAGPRAIALAITRDAYEGDLMARIMSLTNAVFLIVPIIAPAVGELVLVWGSWRATTAVGAVLGVIVAAWFTRIDETLAAADVRSLELRSLVEGARLVVSNRTTALLTLASAMAYGAFFPWLGSSIQMIGEIHGRSGQFALYFAINGVVMALAIVATERLVARYSTLPILLAMSALLVAVAAGYVAVARASGGVFDFWPWFALASILMGLNAGSTPLMSTLALGPMGRVAGMASSITGAVTFVVGALLGGLIDRYIVDTVTPFGVGFGVYGAVALAAVWLGRPSTSAPQPAVAVDLPS